MIFLSGSFQMQRGNHGNHAKGSKAGRMKVLNLFSGIGGFSLGLERAGMETVGMGDRL